MANNDNKPVTKKDLIAILGDFFITTIAPYFDKLENKLDEHDKHFKEIEKHLNEHDKHFERIEEHLDQHDRRFDKLDDRLDRHGKMLDEHEKEIANLQRAILN